MYRVEVAHYHIIALCLRSHILRRYHHQYISMKKKIILGSLVFAVFLGCSTTMTGCKTKEGCGLEDKYKADLSSKKRGKSNLFSKKNRKKVRN